MHKILIVALLLASCASKPSNEMESMTRDVLKSREGIDIQLKPISKDKP